MDIPETRYAKTADGVHIAYQTVSTGLVDIAFVMGWTTHIELMWKEPTLARFLSRLAAFSRLILFDKRGTGLSDRVPDDRLPSLKVRMDDARAVMDAVGSERADCGSDDRTSGWADGATRDPLREDDRRRAHRLPGLRRW